MYVISRKWCSVLLLVQVISIVSNVLYYGVLSSTVKFISIIIIKKINTWKTKALLVTGKMLQHKLSEETATLKLHLDATNIDQLSHHKLQGLIIDKDLSFEVHIDDFCKKLSKRLGLLRHISSSLKQRHKLIFYLTVIKPVMLYFSPIWSSCRKELLERVLRMQKWAARIILDAERTTRTPTMFNELNWIPFFYRGMYKKMFYSL